MKNKKITVGIIVLLIIGGFLYFRSKNKTSAPTYQTAQAVRETLVTTVSSSGSITSGNNISITTNASGTINQVFVKNGDTVVMGQKIASITLDQNALQKQTQAWASYLSAKNQLASAQSNLYQLQAAAFSANQKFINDAAERDLATSDPTYIQEWATWKQAEANYNNQSGQISQAQASLSSAWYNYQQISSTITAPAPGVISNLTVASGSLISGGTTSSNSTSTTPQTIGTVAKTEQTQALVNLSEVDVAKVKPGMKVTITMDAFPTKTFTGKILVINTNGTVSSGVTSYPTTILFDTTADNIYPNMGVSAKIITNVKDNVITVPSAAVQSSNGQTTVRELKNGQLTLIPVEVGDSSDTATEIISGVNEGDLVVTSVIQSSSTTSSSGSSSVFSGLNRGGGAGGAGGATFRRIGG